MQRRLAERVAGIRRSGCRGEEFLALAAVMEPRRTAAEPSSGLLRGLFGPAGNPARAAASTHVGGLPHDLRTTRCRRDQTRDTPDTSGIRGASRSERPHRPAQRSAESLRRKPELRLFGPLGRPDRRDLPVCGIHLRRADAQRGRARPVRSQHPADPRRNAPVRRAPPGLRPREPGQRSHPANSGRIARKSADRPARGFADGQRQGLESPGSDGTTSGTPGRAAT